MEAPTKPFAVDDLVRRVSNQPQSDRQDLQGRRRSVQNGVNAWRFSGARGDQLRLQLSQFGFKLTVDHDERADDAAGIAVASGNEIIDFGIKLGHKNSPATLSDGFNYRLGLASILNNTGVLGCILSVHEYRLRAPFRDRRIHSRLSAIAQAR